MPAENEAPEANDERRALPDDSSRDRRVIPRVSDADLRSHARGVLYLIYFLVAFGALYAVCFLGLRAGLGTTAVMQALFVDSTIVLLIVAALRFAASLRSWIETESMPKLIRVFERARTLLIAVAVVVVVSGVTQLFFGLALLSHLN